MNKYSEVKDNGSAQKSSGEFEASVLSQLEKLNQKIDRLHSILMHLPATHQTNLGDWLTEAQTKELLNLGTTSMWSLRKTEKFKFSKIGGRIYYSRQSILDYLEIMNQNNARLE